MQEAFQKSTALFQNIRKVIYGKDEQIKLLLCCWYAGGHVLIEDAPGTGKTMLARSLAKSSELEFQRIQFTPDLLPSDIAGSHVFDQKKGEFVFHKGPLLTTLLLADEINRATPRTQSALLEAMGEGQVTVDGSTHVLDPMFFVVATQNPIEQMGTFPLPEAQLDRFMIKISMGYPSPQEEIAILKNQNLGHPIQVLPSVCHSADLRRIRKVIPHVKVSQQIFDYIVAVISKTRHSTKLKLGASPRASLAFVRMAQALAFVEGLDHVRPSHVFKLMHPILDHRVVLTSEARLEGLKTHQVIEELVHQVPVPVS